MVSTIGGHSESHLLAVAEEELKKKTKSSVILNEVAEARIPRFQLSGACVCVLVVSLTLEAVPVLRVARYLYRMVSSFRVALALSLYIHPRRNKFWKGIGTGWFLCGE